MLLTLLSPQGAAPPPPPPPVPQVTGGYGDAPRRRRRWHVKRPDGRLEYFDTIEAAYARFDELYAEPAKTDAPRVRRISLPAIPPQTVTFDGADSTRSFAKLARELRDRREAEASARVAEFLRQVEADAIRRAIELDDEEAAAVLLLM